MKNSLDRHQIFSLINVANVKSGLLSDNLVKSSDELKIFIEKGKGIPILIPADEKIFNFSTNDIFKIEKRKLLNLIYGISDINYVGFRHAFKEFKFLKKYELKKNIKNYVENIYFQNLRAIKYVEKLKSKFEKIGSFQTRNIPHFGHEKIIERILSNCNHLVINPIIGPKKSGDFTTSCLNYIYEYLISNKYGNKISFKPIYANMYYAGPREAVHHALIRKKIGFDIFSVGRDHAGAEKIYKDTEASEFIKEKKDEIGISVFCHNGSVFCNSCKKTIILGDCDHNKNHFKDISGSNFRESLINKKLFKFADIKMQKHLFKSKIEIFEK